MAEGFKSNQFHEMPNEKVNLCLQSYAGLLVYGKSPSGLLESGHLGGYSSLQQAPISGPVSKLFA